MSTVHRILNLARGEIGVREDPPGSNRVKYNTAYYGRAVSGENLHWCAVFIWWLFQQTGCAHLYFGGEKTAYCPALLHHHRGQKVMGDYRPGDIIFFNFDRGTMARHVGLCEGWDGTYITTIDGNTGDGNESNGGCVQRRTRHKTTIVGAYRPAYEEDEEMTQEQFDTMMEDYLRRQREKRPVQLWMLEGIEKAKAAGVSDGSAPLALCTRAEAMMMAARAAGK